MFSVRENLVREKQFASHHPTTRATGLHPSVETLTDDASLFLIHRLREKRKYRRAAPPELEILAPLIVAACGLWPVVLKNTA